MAAKYHGLPDIDTAPDIFETADDPEQPLRPNENGLDDGDAPPKPLVENIDATSLPARRKVEKVFGRGTKRPNRSEPAFHFRLPPINRRQSSSSSDSESNYPTPVSEAPTARIRRLKAELEDVERQVASSSMLPAEHGAAHVGEVEGRAKRKSVIPPKQPVNLIAEMAFLRDRLGAVVIDGKLPRAGGLSPTEWKARLERLDKSRDPVLPVESSNDVGENDENGFAGSSTEEGVKLSALDKRLALLEGVIGPSDITLDQTSSSLSSTLTKLDHLLSLLTQPRQLDTISRRVKLLLVDLDRAAAVSRRQATTVSAPNTESSSVTLSEKEYQTLQALFAILPRLDPLIPIVPGLLNRLRSVAGLHAQAGEVAEGLRRLTVEDKRGTEEVRELRGVVSGVQEGLDGAVKGIEKNWGALTKRMEDLEGRIGALS